MEVEPGQEGQMGVYNLDITGFMASFNLVNPTLAGVARP